jgi:arylsulfatase A-like enzyme
MAIRTDQRPNVLLVITHDTGQYLGCYGWPVATPNLDRLAAEGVRFDNHFCVAAQCSPSRSTLMTGRWPHCNGVMGLAPRWTYSPGERTLAHYLAEAGYETALFGLQHEGRDPHRLGYRYTETALASSGFRYVEGVSAPAMVLAAQAAAWIQERQTEHSRPYLLVVGLAETHRPWNRPEYGGGTSSDIRVPPYLPDDPRIREELTQFQGAVHVADQAVGVILRAVDDGTEVERTIVLFTVDHGLAFPRAKGMSYDPGLATALLLRWPGRFRSGTVCADLLCNADIVPTILEACGVPVPAAVQGVSFLRRLTGQTSATREDFFFEMTWHDRYNPHRGIRTQRYKYIRNFGSLPLVFLPGDIARSPSGEVMRAASSAEERPAEELYDLERDPLEYHNLAADATCVDILESLRTRVRRWMKETDDPLLRGSVEQPPGLP